MEKERFNYRFEEFLLFVVERTLGLIYTGWDDGKDVDRPPSQY